VAALQVLAIMQQSGRMLAELVADLPLLPQKQVAVKVAQRFDPGTRPDVVAVRERIEAQLAGRGRVVLRASGTEPVIRVMVEAEERAEAEAAAQALAKAVQESVA
jgi:phosphoglucosamine mutase